MTPTLDDLDRLLRDTRARLERLEKIARDLTENPTDAPAAGEPADAIRRQQALIQDVLRLTF